MPPLESDQAAIESPPADIVTRGLLELVVEIVSEALNAPPNGCETAWAVPSRSRQTMVASPAGDAATEGSTSGPSHRR